MRTIRRVVPAVLALLILSAAGADWIAPAGYMAQNRDSIESAPSPAYPLGTDALGRDRLARLLHGMRVSLLFAPLAALAATVLAAAVGIGAALAGRWAERVVMLATDLMLSLPWIFLLIAVRSALPLETGPAVSLAVTFALLSLLGWAGPARVVRAAASVVRESDYVLAARARGVGTGRVVYRYVLPNVVPVLAAQLWLSIPLFVLGEANLSLLGLGVSEPLPSLGSLLRELESAEVFAEPWLAAPAAALLLVMLCLGALAPAKPENASS